MKITQITINDILGVRQFDAHLVRPVNYIMGKNGAGKSSVREAVKMAFLGSPDRVALKKEYGEILHGAAKTGFVSVETEEHGTPGFTVPKGTHSGATGLDADALPYCIDPGLFASLKADDKRSFLMKLTNTRPDREKIAARMLELEVSQDVIDFVVPMLRQGFPAAAAQAEQQRKDARAAWKAATSETYGEVKAASWKAGTTEYDAGSISEIATAIDTQSQHLEGMISKLGGLRQEKTQVVMVGNTRQKWEADAARLEAAKRKLETDRKNFDHTRGDYECTKARAGSGNREGLIHEIAMCLAEYVNVNQTAIEQDSEHYQRSLKAVVDYEDRYGQIGEPGAPEAIARLHELENAMQLMQRAVDNAERDLKTAQSAADALQREKASAMRSAATIDTEIADLEETIAKEKKFIADYQAQLQAEQEKKRRSQEAEQTTVKAAEYHRQAMAWDKAYAALSPDGIPEELLAAALDPFNAQLKYVAETIGWPVVAIDADMQITLGGRQYRLLSESEQWRTDTVLAIAVSHTAGIDFVVLDRFDVLDNTGRAQAIDGLDVLAEQQIIESALVMGTVKNKPDLAAFDQSAVFWIEAGEIVVEKSDTRKAA